MRFVVFVAVVCLSTSAFGQQPRRRPNDPLADADRTVPQIIRSRGFEAQVHEVQTRDGYILELHRIIVPGAPIGKPVALHHGLFGASSDWVITNDGPYLKDILAANDSSRPIGNNLGFELALKGYDVWLPNSRGNRYSSKKHRFLDTNSKEFWDFSMEEKIDHDLPATIDYILKTTNYATLGYVGHSQGTMIMFGLLSTQPKYNKLIKPFIALAPVTNLGHLKSPLRVLANGVALRVVERVGGPFTLTSWLTRLLARTCPARYSETLCKNALFLGVGFNDKQLVTDRVQVFFSHTPAGTSWKNVIHFAQNLRSDKFARFDYGFLGNPRRYGQRSPPEYPMDQITNRHICLMWSDNDWLTVPQDVASLKRRLTVPLLDDYRVKDPEWNHLDYIWGKEAGKYVYRRVAGLLERHI